MIYLKARRYELIDDGTVKKVEYVDDVKINLRSVYRYDFGRYLYQAVSIETTGEDVR